MRKSRMTYYLWLIIFSVAQLASLEACGQIGTRVQLTLDTSEADQALLILKKSSAHETVTSEDWQRLFSTIPYQWLKAREASMGRALSDAEFERFLASPAAIAKREDWATALAAMKQADMKSLGEAALAWLPAGAVIHAQVFPEIKPQSNSFVWAKPGESPAIFLYLDKQTRAKFENTVTHECHHIGLASLGAEQEKIAAALPENEKKVFRWMGAFGEGEAMLAAAGSVDRHPHWEDEAIDRARWDADMMNFNRDLPAVQQFFEDILDGKLTTSKDIQDRAGPFFGYQGAWYTVGYEMAALVDKEYGRQAFDECLLDPRKLLAMYNQVAQQANAKGAHLATWSPAFLQRMQSPGLTGESTQEK